MHKVIINDALTLIGVAHFPCPIIILHCVITLMPNSIKYSHQHLFPLRKASRFGFQEGI